MAGPPNRLPVLPQIPCFSSKSLTAELGVSFAGQQEFKHTPWAHPPFSLGKGPHLLTGVPIAVGADRVHTPSRSAMNAGKLLGQLHSSFCPLARSPHKPRRLDPPLRGRRGGSTPLRLWAGKCGDCPGRLGASGANGCAPRLTISAEKVTSRCTNCDRNPHGWPCFPTDYKDWFFPREPSQSSSLASFLSLPPFAWPLYLPPWVSLARRTRQRTRFNEHRRIRMSRRLCLLIRRAGMPNLPLWP